VVTFTAAWTASGSCDLEVTVADTHGHTTEGKATIIVEGNSCSVVSDSPAAGPVGEKVVLDCGCVPTSSACSCSHDLSHLKAGCAVDPVSCQVVCQGAPVCDQGDTTAAYNALPFGAVNCATPSQGFEATQTNEFGDEVLLAGTGTAIKTLNVVFASFACQSGNWSTGDCITAPGATFTHPVTAKIYAVASCEGTPCPGDLLGTVTRTLTFPYRPSGSANCPADASTVHGSKWFNPASGICQNQLPSVQTFDFSSLNIAVPAERQVIWTVAFNTSNSGYAPLGTQSCSSTSGGCAYDALNVGAKTNVNAPFAGRDVDSDVAFLSSGTTALESQTGWTGYTPEGEIITN
jgi:hypothetical protein